LVFLTAKFGSRNFEHLSRRRDVATPTRAAQEQHSLDGSRFACEAKGSRTVMSSSSSSPTSSRGLDDEEQADARALPETIELSDTPVYSIELGSTDEDQEGEDEPHPTASSGQPPAHYRPSRSAPHGVPAARKSTFRRPAKQNAVRQRQKATAAGASSRKSRLKQPLIKQEEGFPVPSWPTSPAKPSQPQSSAARALAEPETPFGMCVPLILLWLPPPLQQAADRIAEQNFSFLDQAAPRASPSQLRPRGFAADRRAGSRFPSPRPVYPYRICGVFNRFPSQCACASDPRRWLTLHHFG
jgi:hypothetical protein